MADDADSDEAPDVELMHNLVWVVQEHAVYLSNASRDEPQNYISGSGADGAAGYAEAAAGAFRAFLRRISIVAERLRGRFRGPDAEIVDVVTAMLADLHTSVVPPVISQRMSDDRADSLVPPWDSENLVPRAPSHRDRASVRLKTGPQPRDPPVRK